MGKGDKPEYAREGLQFFFIISVKTLHTVGETDVYVDQAVNLFSLLSYKMHVFSS